VRERERDKFLSQRERRAPIKSRACQRHSVESTKAFKRKPRPLAIPRTKVWRSSDERDPSRAIDRFHARSQSEAETGKFHVAIEGTLDRRRKASNRDREKLQSREKALLAHRAANERGLIIQNASLRDRAKRLA